MRKFRNKAKGALALLLSAAMILGAVPVSWAAEEEVAAVVEEAEITGQSETVADPAAVQEDPSVVEDAVIIEEDAAAEEISEPEAPVAEEPSEPAAEEEQPEADAVEELEIELLDMEETADPAAEDPVYELNIRSDREDGSGNVHPGGQLGLIVDVWDQTNDRQLEADEFTVSWESSDDGIVTVEPDDGRDDLASFERSAIVTTAEDADEKEADITATVNVGGTSISASYTIYVRNGYCTFEDLGETNAWLYPGQSWKYEGQPKVVYYENGEEPEVLNDIEFEWVYNPDEEGNDTYGKNGKEQFTLTKGGNAALTVTAESYKEEEDNHCYIDLKATRKSDPDFGELTYGFNFWVNYNWTEIGENPGRDLFVGETWALSLNNIDDVLRDDKLKVNWSVEQYDENSDKWVPTTIASVTQKSVDKAELTCAQEGRIRVVANILYNGKDAGYAEWEYSVRETIGEYWFDQNGTLTEMPGWEEWIRNTVNYHEESSSNPDGFDREVPVKDVSIKILDGRDDCFTCEYIPEEQAYVVRAESIGTAEVTVTYQTIDGKTAEHKFTIRCTGYYINISNSPDNNGRLQPGGQMTLKAEVNYDHDYQTETNPKNVTIQWKSERDWGDDVITVTPNANDPYICTVKAKNTGNGGVRITVSAVADGKVVAETDTYVSANDYLIDTGLSSSTVRLAEGEEFTLTPSLSFVNENGVKEEVTNVRYEVRDYDLGVIEVTGDGGETMEDGFFASAPDGSFTIRRNEGRRDGTNIYICAYLWNEENGAWEEWETASRDINLEGLDYNVWFDIPAGGDRMYTEGMDTLKIEANTENLERESMPEIGLDGPIAVPEFKITVWDDENSELLEEGSEYTVENNEQGIPAIVSLNCEAVMKWLEDRGYYNQEEDGPKYYRDLRLTASVMGEDYGDQYIEIKHPELESWGEGEYVPGESLVYEKGITYRYVEDAAHPEGATLPFKITDVKIIGWDEESDSPSGEPDTNGILRKETDADGTIRLTAQKEGTVLAQLTVENDEMGEQLFEHLFYVKDAKYTLNVSSSTGTENILPGTSFTVNTEVYKVTSESEKVQEVKLTPDQYSVEFEKTEGDERFQVDRATGKATVSDFDANEDRPEYRVLASVRVPGISEPVADGVIWFYVVPSYHVIEAKKDLIVTPGQTVSLADLGLKLKRFDKAHKDGIEESGGKTNFKIIAENPNKLTVNADGTAFTVSQTAVQAGKAEKAGYYVRATRDRYGNTIDAENYAEITICSHSFAQASRVEATCTAAGSVTSKCSVCGTTKTETIPAKGHTPGAWETTKAASCTAAGEQAQKCSVCGTVLGTKAIPAAGHSFGEWKLTTEPTAVAEGVETRTCGVCGAAETRSVAKLAGVIKLNVKKLPLQVKKSTTAVKVTQMAKGDSIASWKSSKPKIASVSKKGKITGKKKGTATITVTLKSGVKASVKVTVQKNKVTTTKLTVKDGTKTIKNKKLTMKKGAKTTLKTTLTPLTSTDKVTFSSSNKKIVTVSSKGKLTAKKAGKAKITVKAGKKKVVITVTVKKK